MVPGALVLAKVHSASNKGSLVLNYFMHQKETGELVSQQVGREGRLWTDVSGNPVFFCSSVPSVKPVLRPEPGWLPQAQAPCPDTAVLRGEGRTPSLGEFWEVIPPRWSPFLSLGIRIGPLARSRFNDGDDGRISGPLRIP